MSKEIWQIEVGGQIYEAPFAELPDWIGEGSLHPDDKVRKGNLRWIEAKRVPLLVPFFNAKAKGEPMPIVVSDTDAAAGSEQAVEAQTEPLIFAAPTTLLPADTTPELPDNVSSPAIVTVTNPNVC